MRLANWGQNRMTPVSKIILPKSDLIYVIDLMCGNRYDNSSEKVELVRKSLLAGEGKVIGIPLEFE